MLINNTTNPHGNCFTVPNEIYNLGLSMGAIAVYGFLLRLEDRHPGKDQYTCHPSYLNRDGIRQIRSQLTNDVFKHEMLQLYEQKSTSRDALVREARHALMELADRMQHTLANGPAIEDRMQALAQALDEVCGKHQYGYLKKPVKR